MFPRVVLAVGFVLALAACGGGEAEGEPGDTTVPTSTSIPDVTSTSALPVDLGPAGTLPQGPSALRSMTSEDFPDPLVPVGDIMSGGPPPDGIPPIDDPAYVTIDVAGEYLADDEPVVVVDIGGDVRVYPAQILIWHEIVNDTIGGVPISVTYCPLCNSAVSYRRVVNGVETTFGTSGRLFNSALVMYDRATESLWTHYDGRAVVGLLTGAELEQVASPLMAWGDVVATYPDALVLDRDRTGHSRRYGSNPYVGYDDPDGFPFLFRGDADSRARELQRVVGIALDGDAVAYSLDRLQRGEASVTPVSVGNNELVILWKSGQSSALDDASVSGARDVGTVGVFVPVVDGLGLTFSALGDEFLDEETGSTWNIAGIATDGPLEGSQLERVVHLDTFWFAWSTYRPGTSLIAGSS